jgi:aminopeptidase S
MPFSASRAVRSCARLVLVGITFMLMSGCGSTIRQTPSSVQPPTAQASSVQPSSVQSSTLPAEGQLAQRLANEVSDTGAFAHLEALQRIADENGGNRAAPSAGFESSVDYVVGVLRAAGYDVSTPTGRIIWSMQHTPLIGVLLWLFGVSPLLWTRD